MKIDLNEKVTRFLVQEYVNAIVNCHNTQEVDYDIHKLKHTFEVVDVANELLKLTNPPLTAELEKHIINAAVLHDVARCYEFQNGQKKKGFDHGKAGAELIKKEFPEMYIEQGCTLWHNRIPTADDPIELQPVLDYTRDSDILGNIRYTINHPITYLEHIFDLYLPSNTSLMLDYEIQQAAKEKRKCLYEHFQKFEFLDMVVTQLLWVYNLKTKAAFCYAKQQNLFARYRDIIINQYLPRINGTDEQRYKTAELMMKLFPDSLFEEEFKKHGL